MYLPMGLSARRNINLPGQMNADSSDKIFNIKNQGDFESMAMEVFDYQYNNNAVYQCFIRSLGRISPLPSKIEEIPFLPVEFFRDHEIITGNSMAKIIFESSGTTGVIPGKHYVTDPGLYETSFLKTFRLFYGDPEDYLIVALLPSYTEREGSSLVYMADRLIRESHNPLSGFYRNDVNGLLDAVKHSKKKGLKTLLIGVSFALLDLAENQSPDLSGVLIMETGGMKGRRKEITRLELHSILKRKFNVHEIHSEYGMTELLSQAYSSGDEIFYCPPWMKVMIRDPQDPLSVYTEPGRTGGINIIDLANINSCSFIATGDLGRLHVDGGLEVLGRFDNSDIRGCNLLTE
jgi:hypothetical protein